MLEVLVHKDNGYRALSLAQDISINIVIENPFTTEDRIPVPYSLTFDLPKTIDNLSLLDYPHRVGAVKSEAFQPKPSVIRFHGLNILYGHLQLLKVGNTLQMSFIGVDYLEKIKRPLYELNFGNIPFPGLYNSVDFTNPYNFAYQYLQWANSLVDIDREDYVAAPIALKPNQPWTIYTPVEVYQYNIPSAYIGKYTWKNPIIFNDLEFLNAYNVEEQTFLIEKKSSAGYYHPVRKACASIFPIFRVGFILEKIFGDVLLSNPFKQGDLFKLGMPTYYFSKWKQREMNDVNFNTDYPPMVSNPRPSKDDSFPGIPYVDLSDYMPDIKANDFVIQLLNTFCMTMYPNLGKLEIKTNSQICHSMPLIDWTDKMLHEYELEMQQGLEYNYGYANVSDSDSIHSIDHTVSNIYEMVSMPYSLDSDGFYSENFLIESTGQIIRKIATKVKVDHVYPNGEAEETQVEYLIIKKGFGGNKETESEQFNIKSSLGVLPDIPAKYFENTENNTSVAASTKIVQAPALYDVDRTVRPTEAYLVWIHDYYHTQDGNPAKSYPLVSSHVPPMSGEGPSLDWEGENGLLQRYHLPFKSWVEKDKLKMTASFLLSVIDLQKLDITSKLHVKGKNFFIQKLQFTLFRDHISPVLAELIQA